MAAKKCLRLALFLFLLGLLSSPSCMADNVLRAPNSLPTGASLDNGPYTFIMQSDCNLVLYDNGRAIWSSRTNGRGNNCRCTMQRDGNLVIYNSSGAVWSSRTNRAGSADYSLVLQRDRNVVIYDSSGRAIWATGTNLRRAGVKAADGAKKETAAASGAAAVTAAAGGEVAGVDKKDVVTNNKP